MSIELVVLSTLFVFVFIGMGILVMYMQRAFNKQVGEFKKTQDKATEMYMAGSYQEWQRIKEGKRAQPNDVKAEPNMIELTEETRIPYDEIKHVQVEDGPRQKIKIYK